MIVASKGGWPEDPAWFKNMSADPSVEIQVRGERLAVQPSVAEGEERERLWGLMTEAWPDYDWYAKRTDREIPVVILTPRA